MIGSVNSGGAALNFKLIYASSISSLPKNARKNTIAVILYSVKNYIISACEPENPVDGLLWFYVGANYRDRFMMVKRPRVDMSIVKCLRYCSGKYAEVDAYIWNGVEWKRLGREDLYIPGDECEYVTGGWTVTGPPYSGDFKISFTPTRTDKHIYASTKSEYLGSDAKIGSVFRPWNKIDLTPYSKLIIRGSYDGANDYANAWFACWPEFGDTYQQNAAVVKKYTKEKYVDVDIELDVSGLNGLHYVGVGFRHSAITIKECYLTTKTAASYEEAATPTIIGATFTAME